ncbi:MAG: hypothetical protein R3325_16295 [Thermoanaerobaculia bacterium]|nr:hypothetical protein [Thermoanaerobaculia bacterium]
MTPTNLGAILFGLVIGWVTYRTLRRKEGKAALSDISAVIGAVGGAAVTKLFPETVFGYYCIGLGAGFFLYLLSALAIEGQNGVVGWMGNDLDSGSGRS